MALGKAIGIISLAVLLAWAPPVLAQSALRVCADPNNLPFSNDKGEGFENKIVELLAKDMGAKLEYTWWAQRRGYIRNTLNAEKCDLWPGVATAIDMMATSRPYYRSSYMFVTRTDRHLNIASFDDPVLRHLRIGVQMVGNDAQNTPPTHALARRGIIANVRGYMLYGDYERPNPPAAIIDAVEHGDIDVAIVWGPLAGYFASKEPQPLALVPVQPAIDGAQWPMVFDISMGMRRYEPDFMEKIDQFLIRERPAIDAILAQYHVPRVNRETGEFQSAQP
ncbi:MAG TPA: substrate-binding domain-containing protein [Methylovirgula sp.]|nr:substrate-binding domain-containing protein [Methylovirgula sp.]